MRRWILLLAALAGGAPARAGQARWVLRSDVLGGANPPGLMAVGSLVRRADFDGRALEGGISAGISPAYGQGSLELEATPFPFFVLAARADVYRFLGQHDALLSFPSADAPFGQKRRDELSGEDEPAYGRRFVLQPTLRAKVGRLVAVNQTDAARYSFSGRGPFFLELEYDTLLKNWDTLLANRTFVLWTLRDGDAERALIGPYYDFQHSRGSRLERARLGVAFDAARFKAWRGADARLYLLPGFDLRDPNRRHSFYFAGGVGLDFSRP